MKPNTGLFVPNGNKGITSLPCESVSGKTQEGGTGQGLNKISAASTILL